MPFAVTVLPSHLILQVGKIVFWEESRKEFLLKQNLATVLLLFYALQI